MKVSDLRLATEELFDALERGARVLCVHYACEDIFAASDRPAAIAAIGVSEIHDADGDGRQEVKAFSIQQTAPSSSTEERERQMLEEFFQYVQAKPDSFWAHWNMTTSPAYGFTAMVDRYRYLTNEEPPVRFPPDRTYDLDAIVGDRFGARFAQHPKLKNLCQLNGFYMPFFQDGRVEADAYARGDFSLCQRSAAEKARFLGRILTALRKGSLKTANSVGRVPFAESHLDAVQVVLAIGDRFRSVQRQLSRRHGQRDAMTFEDEYDDQDLLHALLRLYFDDVRAEEYSPSYAGGNSRIDFVLPQFALAIELKHTRTGLTDKDLGAQLIIDRERYQANHTIRHLLCLVFDYDSQLSNPRGLERDLISDTSADSFAVTVRIYDH